MVMMMVVMMMVMMMMMMMVSWRDHTAARFILRRRRCTALCMRHLVEAPIGYRLSAIGSTVLTLSLLDLGDAAAFTPAAHGWGVCTHNRVWIGAAPPFQCCGPCGADACPRRVAVGCGVYPRVPATRRGAREDRGV
jgi:hypothetical protein